MRERDEGREGEEDRGKRGVIMGQGAGAWAGPKHAHDPSARHVPLLEHGAADPPSHSRLQSAPRNPV